jgi:hypothetical protein
MAGTPDVTAETAKLIEHLKLLEDSVKKLKAMKSVTLNAYCNFDVGMSVIGPGGPGGQWVDQCRNYAIAGTNPALCKVHARLGLSRMYGQVQAEIMRLNKIPIKLSTHNSEVYDPEKLLVTLSEYDNFIKDKSTLCDPTTTPLPDDNGAVFGRTQALCKAFK